jgi:glycosyltransferase involved in cell wall biosynthesis
VAPSSIIGIDGSRLSIGERTGTETYSYHLLKSLASLDRNETIRVYLNATEQPVELPSKFEYVAMPFPRFWTHGRLSWEMLRRRPGVLFVPSHVVPLWHPRSVVTIHDLGYLREPDAHPPAQRRMLDWTTRWSCRSASKIIAISDATKHDLVTHYGVNEQKIRVIYHGISSSMTRASDAAIEGLKTKYGLPDRYVLFVGTVQPRKNIARIAAAMKIVSDAGLPQKLVVAGKPGWLSGEVEWEIAKIGRPDLVVRIGYVPDRDLAALYSEADAFCFPSMYEGFGLPILEAMACGTPVVTSTRGSLPEIAGDAAVLVDPTSVEAIGAALVRVLSSPDERVRLIDIGQQRAHQFSWDACAKATLDLLIEVRDKHPLGAMNPSSGYRA